MLVGLRVDHVLSERRYATSNAAVLTSAPDPPRFPRGGSFLYIPPNERYYGVVLFIFKF